jgi:hypothetical protein
MVHAGSMEAATVAAKMGTSFIKVSGFVTSQGNVAGQNTAP